MGHKNQFRLAVNSKTLQFSAVMITIYLINQTKSHQFYQRWTKIKANISLVYWCNNLSWRRHTLADCMSPLWASQRPSIVWLCLGMRFPDKVFRVSEEATDLCWPLPPQHSTTTAATLKHNKTCLSAQIVYGQIWGFSWRSWKLWQDMWQDDL